MILDKFKLDGKTALVTGSNQGIGQAYAVALAQACADIIGVSYQGDFSETEKLISETGRKFTSYVADFNNRNELNDFIKKVKTDFLQINKDNLSYYLIGCQTSLLYS